ncbi:MAG TPA: hypothetical protein PKG96_05400 [Bacilli bacterium]|nr:hypothetical protein [Bacilli bacterium]
MNLLEITLKHFIFHRDGIQTPKIITSITLLYESRYHYENYRRGVRWTELIKGRLEVLSSID